jgi:prepilin-type processing-associated H-X9-DG protein
VESDCDARSRFHIGFTLVELLVAMGIIFLMASILLPVLARARSHAQLVRCASNLRSLAQAAVMYRNDNRGIVPHDRLIGGGSLFALQLAPYVGLPKIPPRDNLEDPSWMAHNFYSRAPVFQCPVHPRDWPVEYTLNTIDFAGYLRTGEYVPPSPDNEVRRFVPENAAFLMEQPHAPFAFVWKGRNMNTWGVWHVGQMTFDASGNPNRASYMVWSTDQHHDGKTPFAFLDGHVEIRRITPQEIPIQLLNPLAPR